MFILIGARVFSLSFYGVNGHIWVEHLLVAVPGGQTGFLIFVSLLVFLLAFFLDFFELAFIIAPPFGFSLFYLRSVAPKQPYSDKVTGLRMAPVTTAQIYWGAIPFVVIQVVMVGVVIAFPGLVMHYKGVTVDPAAVEITMPALPTLNGGGIGGAPNLGAPVLGAPVLGAPKLGAPVINP